MLESEKPTTPVVYSAPGPFLCAYVDPERVALARTF